ncbi:hypothetical protein D3C79_899430 [compost metagenome]
MQQRDLDVFQVDLLASDAQPPFKQRVLFSQVLIDLSKVFAWKRQGFVTEASHHAVTFNVVVVPHVVPKPDLAGNTACWSMQFNCLDDGLGRDNACRIDQALSLEMTLAGQRHFRPVDGRGEAHQVFQGTVRM